jgi:hypothetical protein
LASAKIANLAQLFRPYWELKRKKPFPAALSDT